MELIKQYHELWFERQKYNKDSWIEGCNEWMSDVRTYNQLRYRAVPGTLVVKVNGVQIMQGVDFLMHDDNKMEIVNKSLIGGFAMLWYTGYLREGEKVWS